jgi:arabinogalactan oligomer / maltooligosaccharide transport system permease protein
LTEIEHPGVRRDERTELEVLRRRARRRKFLVTNLKRLVIWIVIILTLAPGWWIVVASVTKGDAFFSASVLPGEITLDNYRAVLRDTNFLDWIKNSMIVCTAVAGVSTIACALAAYAFSRLRFWGRRYGLMGMLIIQMFPVGVATAAYFYALFRLGEWTNGKVGLDTHLGLILVLAGGGVAFYAWLFKGYLDNLPRELEEAAFVDGASRLKTMWYVLFPLARPIIAVIFLLLFIGTYSEYLLTSIILTDNTKWTLPLGLNGFIFNQFNQHWTQFAAAAVMGSIPLMIVFLLMQRYLVAGLARGAVKG